MWMAQGEAGAAVSLGFYPWSPAWASAECWELDELQRLWNLLDLCGCHPATITTPILPLLNVA
jgi:hypothetical protein